MCPLTAILVFAKRKKFRVEKNNIGRFSDLTFQKFRSDGVYLILKKKDIDVCHKMWNLSYFPLSYLHKTY